MGDTAMIVNELAKRVGVEPHVVRYYARIGLLKPKRDRWNGYKQFSNEDVRRLEFIREAQHFGFTLSEIATVLEQHETKGCECCKTMYTMLRQRIEEHRRKLEEMIAQQQHMDEALQRWDAAGGAGCEGSPVCPAIRSGGCRAGA